MNTETTRLNFLIQRDGLEGAVDFAQRTLVAYRRHVLVRKRLRFETSLRQPFVESYIAFKQFILDNG